MTETHDVLITRVFNAPVEQVWNAWVESDQVRQWWGPQGFTSPLAEMDVREGGRSLVCMRAPAEMGGQDLFNTWTYTKVVLHQRLEYVFEFTDQDGTAFNPAEVGMPAGIPKGVPHEITFKNLGTGGTEVTVRESGYTAEDVMEMSRQGMTQCLDKMASLFS
ncbi:MAG: SRPBCC domain-containing protein [Dehalococcoidia bacterium]|nr:SRPBCC domain-containing protein [Dehalococcoidia bacterium]